MKALKITYFISTTLLSVLLLVSVGMYLFNHSEIEKGFTSFGYPTYLIYPLAIAKLLGLIVIWVNKFKLLKDFAYAGIMFNLVLAIFAHVAISDGEFGASAIGLVLWVLSFYSYKRAKI